MIGSTIHKILYGAAGIVALAHVVFAAVEAGHSLYYPIPVEMVNTKGDPFMSFQRRYPTSATSSTVTDTFAVEENPKFPLAIVHTIICGFILIYYCAQYVEPTLTHTSRQIAHLQPAYSPQEARQYPCLHWNGLCHERPWAACRVRLPVDLLHIPDSVSPPTHRYDLY